MFCSMLKSEALAYSGKHSQAAEDPEALRAALPTSSGRFLCPGGSY